MRPSHAVPILAGLLLGWAAIAQADSPPAAPIFYCPTPGKAPPPAAAAPSPAQRRAGPTAPGCPVARIPASHHPRYRPHPAAHRRLVVARRGDDGVSASQAFIYRYERAMHGLDARAAQQAWAEGGSPCPPHRAHCWAGPPHPAGPALAPDHGVPPGPGPMAHAGPPPHGMPPGPPPGARVGPPPGPPPGRMHAPPAMAEAGPPPRPSVHAYAWNGPHSGYAVEAQEMRSEREGGWRYSEIDGHARFHRWGDRFADEPGMGGGWGAHGAGPGGHFWDGRRGPCPPPVAAAACGAAQGGPPPEAYEEAGRDAAGFLTWPGKTPPAW